MMIFTGGRPETLCGKGSTLLASGALRKALPGLFQRLDVYRLVDAPCGDMNWISTVDMANVDYIGIDEAPEHLKTAAARIRNHGFEPKSCHLIIGDILTRRLPYGDAVLCRDFLQHLPNFLVWNVLRNFVDSGSRWLLATSHTNEANVDISTIGGFRALNLFAPPFNLPETDCIDDPPGSGRVIGVWTKQMVGAAVRG